MAARVRGRERITGRERGRKMAGRKGEIWYGRQAGRQVVGRKGGRQAGSRKAGR